ncbi:hypothetical protein VTN31DRAFT_4719 [Thermomyces dupontii]|uniref:uncharacterized protein n=1 Tax=Talaromyces thermophilus TaxID=28565 RepID=UPI0037425F87
MLCPIRITKFVGTVSLGLLTGLSYSMANIVIPSLKALPTAANGTRALKALKRSSRKHALRLANLSTGCLLFAWLVAPKRAKHPYLLWVSITSTLGAFGVDYWFNRQLGLKGWACGVLGDLDVPSLGLRKQPSQSPKKDEDLVVVEAESDVNGEMVEQDMDQERKLHSVRTWLSGAALTMAIVGLWGDRA